MSWLYYPPSTSVISKSEHQQQGNLGKDRARMCWPHIAEGNIWHNKAAPSGIRGYKEGRKTSENQEEVSRGEAR